MLVSSFGAGRSRRGVILVLALVIALILVTAIFVFHTLTMQGKVEISRSLLGDVALYLAESAAEEAARIVADKANYPPGEWYERFQEGLAVQNNTYYPVEGLRTLEESALAGEFGATVTARARVLVLGSSGKGDPREKVGSLEVEGKAVVPLGKKTLVIRRVIVRKDFKGIYLAGKNPISDYTLFVKDITGMPRQSASLVNPDEPALIVKNRRDPATAMEDSGCLFLGRGPGPKQNDPIYLLYPGRGKLIPEEVSYLQGIPLVLSPRNPQRYEMGAWEPDKRQFVDDSVGKEKAGAIIADILSKFRTTDGSPLDPAQVDGVVARVQDARLQHEFVASGPRSAGLDLYVNDPGQAIEGNLVYPYSFQRTFEFTFNGSAPPSNPSTQVAIEVSAVSFLNKDPNGLDQIMAPLDHARGFQALDEAQKFEKALSAHTFIYPRFYSRLFMKTIRQPDPVAEFRRQHIFRTPSGQKVLYIDGIVGLLGDLELEEDLQLRGQGVLITLGKLTLKGSLRKRRETDLLFLVTRGKSIGLPGGKRVEAVVQGLHPKYPDELCTLDVNGSGAIDLLGGLAMDRIDAGRLQATKNLVQFDELLTKWVFHTSVSDRTLLWTMRTDDESTPREQIN